MIFVIKQETEPCLHAFWFLVTASDGTTEDDVLVAVREAGLSDLEDSEGFGPLEAMQWDEQWPDLPEIDLHNLRDSPNLVRHLRRQIEHIILICKAKNHIDPR